MASEHHADTGVLEAHGQDAFVDLVELHKLQEVNEERQAVVDGQVVPASIFALQRGETRRVRDLGKTLAGVAFLQTEGNSQGSPGSV